MTPLLSLCRALPEHLPALVDLDRRCLGGMWTISGYQGELDNPHSQLWVLLLTIFEPVNSVQLIGCGAFWEILEEAHIILLMIAPDYQGRGFGHLLLQHLLQQAINRQLTRATLEVKSSNHTAIALYQHYGFKVAGIRKGYYQETGEDAQILWQNGLDYPTFQAKLNEQKQALQCRLGDRGFTTN